MKTMRAAAILLLAAASARGQSADWHEVVWREPQVRYLLADMALGGDESLYRKYATEERDPDSREAIRLHDAGVRVVNAGDFERKWVPSPFGKDGRVMRIVARGSNRAITGEEIFLTNDRDYQQAPMRAALAAMTLGAKPSAFEAKRSDPSVAEALRRWADGVRATNVSLFQFAGTDEAPTVVYRGTTTPIDGARVRLNSDVPYSETNARYFLADIYLGGGRAFYERAAESAHETRCREAVARFDAGVKIVNLADFDRKVVAGKTLITRKGSDARIRGMELKLSTD